MCKSNENFSNNLKSENTLEFIRKARLKHGDKYGYDEVEYVKSQEKVKIFCYDHGFFEQRPNGHLNGNKCKHCSINDSKSNIEDFIKKAHLIHGDIYNYDGVEYLGCNFKIKIECKIHGFFEQKPSTHLQNKGCKECGKDSISKKNTKSSELFFEQCKLIHNNYYTYNDSNYINGREDIIITCPIHGNYIQQASKHLEGHGCVKCCRRDVDYSFNTNTLEDFIKDSKEIHGDKYIYHHVIYKGSKNPVEIECIKHGIFLQTPNTHTNGKYGHGCPKCNYSKGERIIDKFLTKNNIKYEIQKKFKDCINKQPLPFDFYLPDFNLCIEFDGEQHYKVKKFFGGEQRLKETQFKDNIKTLYCLNNNLHLLRIRYDKLNNINDILNDLFNIRS